MTKRMEFYWIDDEVARQKRVNSINGFKMQGSIPRANVKFFDASNKEFNTLLNETQQAGEPSLILVDHFLRLKGTKGTPEIAKGTTFAQAIKNKWPSCPIVGVTAAVKRPRIKWQGENAYDELFEVDSLRDNYSSLFIIAHYFNLLVKEKPRNKEEISRLLVAPQDDKQQLLSIMPDFSLSTDIGQTHYIFNWVKKLIDKPGFLLDKLWVATILGIKETSLDKVIRIFEPARYRGLFSNPIIPRWWSSQIKKILYQKISATTLKPTWELGHKLRGVASRDLAKCYKCDGKFPEVVAFTDRSHKTPKPMHLKCTYVDPSDKRELYFYEKRIMGTRR